MMEWNDLNSAIIEIETAPLEKEATAVNATVIVTVMPKEITTTTSRQGNIAPTAGSNNGRRRRRKKWSTKSLKKFLHEADVLLGPKTFISRAVQGTPFYLHTVHEHLPSFDEMDSDSQTTLIQEIIQSVWDRGGSFLVFDDDKGRVASVCNLDAPKVVRNDMLRRVARRRAHEAKQKHLQSKGVAISTTRAKTSTSNQNLAPLKKAGNKKVTKKMYGVKNNVAPHKKRSTLTKKAAIKSSPARRRFAMGGGAPSGRLSLAENDALASSGGFELSSLATNNS